MTTKREVQPSPRQRLLEDLFIGTLIYASTLGFYNDYTDVVTAKSFSTIFFAALMLQIMTLAAFRLKSRIVRELRGKQGTMYPLLMFLSVWFVMFSSKFVFVWVLDAIFGEYVNIQGFFGILLVVASVTLVHRLYDRALKSLGGN